MNAEQDYSAENYAAIRDQRLRNVLAGRRSGPAIIGDGGSAFARDSYPAAMVQGWADYFKRTDLIDKGYVPVGSGGKLSMVAEGQAVYWREGIQPFTVWKDSELMLIANIDPKIGEAWEAAFPGFKVVRME